MGRKAHRVDAAQGGDITIDLLVRHADVPQGAELLERYSRTYSCRPAGFVAPIEPVVEPPVVEPETMVREDAGVSAAAMETELEVPPSEYRSLEEVVAAAGDDTDNDYDAPGATVAMEAVDVPVETMTFDAAEIDAMVGDDPAADLTSAEIETVEVEAAELPGDESEGDDDENATVMMGAVDVSAGAAVQDDASNRRKKKRRHR